MQDFYHVTVSNVLNTAQNGVRCHRDADSHLKNRIYRLIRPIMELVKRFVKDCGIFRLLEGSPYNSVLALLCLKRISELYWVITAHGSLWFRPYLSYALESVAVHPTAEVCNMEPLYSNTVLTGHWKRRFRTKTVIYRSDSNFRNTIPYVELHVMRT